MKTRQSLNKWLVACGFAVVAVLAAQGVQAQAVKDGKAIVKFVSGTVNCTGADGTLQPLTAGMKISTGATIQAANNPDSYADLSVNERSSMVRVTPGSSVKIDKMVSIGGADTETVLNLQEGTVLGSVKKLSKASHFDVKVANGVAGIRGTDFAVTMKRLTDGKWEVTFTSVKGEVVATAIIPGRVDPITNVLHDGESWTPGSEIVRVDLQQYVEPFGGMREHTEQAEPSAPVGPGGVNNPINEPLNPPLTPVSPRQ